MLVFFFQINIRVSYKLMLLLLLMDVARHAQSTQNKKLATSFAIFQERGEG